MMMDLTSSIVDGLLVFLGVVSVVVGGIQTIHSDATTMCTTSDPTDAITTQPSHPTTSLSKAA